MKAINKITRISVFSLLTITIIFFNIDSEKIICLAEVSAGPPHGEWKLIWHDEFNGTEIDTTKWSWFLGWDKRHYREAYYTTEDAYIQDGNLFIRVRNDKGLYKTSWLWTKDKFQHKYGYYEIRCKFSELKARGNWVAFWLYTPVPDHALDGNIYTGCEIDIMEYPWMDSRTHHWAGCTPNSKSSNAHIEKTEGLREGFHIFGLLWTEKEYVYYIDGIEIFRINQGISHGDQIIIISDEVEAGIWGDMGDIRSYEHLLPDYWIIDYIRVYDRVTQTD